MSYTDFGIHEIRVGQIHRRPTHPKIRVGLVLHVLHGSGAYVGYFMFPTSNEERNTTIKWSNANRLKFQLNLENFDKIVLRFLDDLLLSSDYSLRTS